MCSNCQDLNHECNVDSCVCDEASVNVAGKKGSELDKEGAKINVHRETLFLSAETDDSYKHRILTALSNIRRQKCTQSYTNSNYLYPYGMMSSGEV